MRPDEIAGQRWRAVFDHSPVAMAELSLDGSFLATNGAFGQMLYAEDVEELPKAIQDLVQPDDLAAFQAWIGAHQTSAETKETFQLRYRGGSRGPRWLELRLFALPSADGATDSILLFLLDGTSQRHLQAEVGFLLDHDPLTGLISRSAVEEELRAQFESIAADETFGLIVLDVDYFVALNQNLGTNVGDEVLVAIAGILRKRLRGTDLIARIGDDEFGVILPHTTQARAEVVTAALLRDVHNQATVKAGGYFHQVTVSAGIVIASRNDDIKQLFTSAIDALEIARGQGGGKYVVHLPGQGDSLTVDAARVLAKVDPERFVLLAQPILEVATDRVDRYEFYLRLRDDDGTLLAAREFLPEAERHGRVGRIDRWVIERAIEFVAAPSHGDVRLHVNLSGRSLGDPFLMAFIESQLLKSGVDPTRLVFEVGEAEATANTKFTAEFSNYLMHLGCQFAIDRVGSVGGGIEYLATMPFNFVKIGGESLRTAAETPGDRLVIEAIVSIAKGLGRQTIAGPVENAETLAMLKKIGVDFVQGNYIGVAVPLESALRR